MLMTLSSPRALRSTPMSLTQQSRVVLPLAARAWRARESLVVTNAVGAAAQKDLPASLKKLVTAFQMVPDPMARYKQLLYYAAKLKPMAQEDHIASNKVEGCVSQVWVKPELRDDGLVYWQADSDSQLTKGLAALLVTGLSGCSPVEILSVQPEGFIDALGLRQSLTPSRNNGFLNMFKLMQRKSLAFLPKDVAAPPVSPDSGPAGTDSADDSAAEDGTPAAAAAARASPSARPDAHSHANNSMSAAASHSASTNGAADSSQASGQGAVSSSNSSSSGSSGSSRSPMQDSMRRNLTAALSPVRLVIENQSHQHAGHAGARDSVSPGESHFRLEVVSAAFEGLSLVKRHRLVYQVLQQELANGLHALSLDTKAPTEV